VLARCTVGHQDISFASVRRERVKFASESGEREIEREKERKRERERAREREKEREKKRQQEREKE